MDISKYREKVIHSFISRDNDLYINKTIYLSIDETAHMSRSLRLGKGDMVRIVNGDGNYYLSEIIECGESARLIVLAIEASGQKRPYEICAIVPVIKKARFEILIEKLTELGVDKIMPYHSLQGSQSKVRLSQNLVKRWESIIASAVKQSKRATIPLFEKPVDLDGVLSNDFEEYATKILLEIGSENLGKSIRGNICFISGPEGGFSTGERGKIIKRGFVPASISGQQLRAETSVMLMCGIIEYLRRV